MESPPRHDSSERSVPDDFETFDLSIQRIGETYRATVTASPVGEGPPVEIDPSGLTLERPATEEPPDKTRDIRRQAANRDDLRAVGKRLFETVLVGRIIEAYRASIERARNRGRGLRICLKLDEAAELAMLPWEALWDPEIRMFLADQPDLPIVRTLRITEGSTVDSAEIDGPLRLLAMLPEPQGERKLGGAVEWQQIQSQLAGMIQARTVAVDQVSPATLETLGRRVDAKPCHVLHIVAHGGTGNPGDGGLLLLESASGKPNKVNGGELARALARRTPPRLVVINACHGARATARDAFDGLAQRLLSHGVGAVVAMRQAISDDAAVDFAVALYRQLVMGRTIEASVIDARRALSLGERRVEWATPVLYSREANVRIFGAPSTTPLTLLAADKAPGIRRVAKPAVAFAVASLLTALGWKSLPRDSKEQAPIEPDQPRSLFQPICPTPHGLEDLEFVYIDPDVVKAGDRKIIVDNAFCIATKEISRRDWLAVMGGPLRRPEWSLDWPMTHVTIADVSIFMKNLETRHPGVTYRLPTADEWEFAGRAGQETDYFFGDDAAQLHRYGNCDNFLGQDGFDGPAPVGSFLPNAWGLYDVHGNVAEWVQWPEGEERQSSKGEELALRLGGTFGLKVGGCTFSGSRSPVLADNNNREDTGFRVVREVDDEGGL